MSWECAIEQAHRGPRCKRRCPNCVVEERRRMYPHRDLYDIAREVTDEVMGEGTYATLNESNPNPGVQAAITRGKAMKPVRVSMRHVTTREEAKDMQDAHVEGYHTPPEGLPREGCPDCENRPLRTYPLAADLQRKRDAAA